MGSLGTLLKNIQKGQKLIITPRIEQWLVQTGEITLDPEMASILFDILSRRENADRSGRFGASSRGTCLRQQIFSYLGMAEMRAVNPQLQNLFNDGNWRHLRWQMMGLLAGVFTHVEVPVKVPHLRLKISLDAANEDENWFFELKGSSNWSSSLDGVPDNHLLQIHTCMLASGLDRCVYVVEDKRSLEWREIIVDKDPAVMQRVKRELAVLNECVEERRLPEVLGDCWGKTGPAYQKCPYGRYCIEWERNGGGWPGDPDWRSTLQAG